MYKKKYNDLKIFFKNRNIFYSDEFITDPLFNQDEANDKVIAKLKLILKQINYKLIIIITDRNNKQKLKFDTIQQMIINFSKQKIHLNENYINRYFNNEDFLKYKKIREKDLYSIISFINNEHLFFRVYYKNFITKIKKMKDNVLIKVNIVKFNEKNFTKYIQDFEKVIFVRLKKFLLNI